MKIREKHLRKLFYIVLILLLLTTSVGRVVSLPFFLFIVSGRSMQPTLYPGDIVLAISGSFKEGDIVIWCTSPIYCVAHRVEKISGNIVYTKGDANPIEDPPISANMVIYRVIGKIPNYLWLTPLLCILIYLSYRKIYVTLKLRPWSFKRGEPLSIAATIVAVFILIDILVLSLTPLPVGSITYYMPKPIVELKSLKRINCDVAINYNVRFTTITGVSTCAIYVSNRTYGCLWRVINGRNILIQIPGEAYWYAYSKGINRLNLALNVSLKNGWLIGNYTIFLKWKKPTINVEGFSVKIHNPNPILLNLTIRILYFNYSVFGTPEHVMTQNLGLASIAPYSTWSYVIKEKSAYAYVELEYFFMGEKVFERKRIIFKYEK